MDYKVLSVHDWYDMAIYKLSELVRNHLNAGWKPLGGMQMCPSGESGSGNVIVSQTLVREKP